MNHFDQVWQDPAGQRTLEAEREWYRKVGFVCFQAGNFLIQKKIQLYQALVEEQPSASDAQQAATELAISV